MLCTWNILTTHTDTACHDSSTSGTQTGYAYIKDCTNCWTNLDQAATFTVSAAAADGLSSDIENGARWRRSNSYALAQLIALDGSSTDGWTSRKCLSGSAIQTTNDVETGNAFSAQPSGSPTELRVTNSTCPTTTSGGIVTYYFGVATVGPFYNYGDDIKFSARLTGTTGSPQIQPRIRTVVGGGSADTVMALSLIHI